MRCSNCGSDNPADRKFCGECGAQFRLRCPKCGKENVPPFRFCGDCGAALTAAGSIVPTQVGASVRREATAPEALEGERKTVTALFADLKGSTELMESLDPEEARTIVDPALGIMVEAVRRYEGYVVQSTGDGIFALFGAPAAYEDHPQRSLYAALQMQQNLGEYAQRLVSQGRPPLEARFGVNTGEVVVRTVETGGKVEYTPIGHTANLAARLQTLAPAGSIAISADTRKLVEGYFELRALGSMPVRGISAPVDVYEVLGLGPLRSHFELSARRGLTRFIGRERELQQINNALELSMSGHGQLVAVVAEAGTGKSRLFHEFKTTLPAKCKLLEAYSMSYGTASAWLPVLELLRGYVGIQDADDPPARRERVHAKLTALDPALSDMLPHLWGLLGIQESLHPLAQMDPQIRRQRTLDAIKRIILRESRAQPTIIIFEDLHWIDSETQALLDLLADSIGAARLLLLVNYRPEYRHEWSSRRHYLQIRLDPLNGENTTAMLSALLGDSADLDGLKHLIAERTGGNPFFVEEMVQALFEQGILASNGTVKLVRPLAEVHLPVTVQGVLGARIDRLAPHEKELLQTLAVIGNEFPLAMARSVTQWPEEALQRGLANLRLGEFIYERPLSAGIEYSFKHALTHEVAYNSLLMQRRKVLHERAGQALESMFANQLDDHVGDLARHYSGSDNIAKAVEYLGRAGEQGLQRCTPLEATRNLALAIDLLQKKFPKNADRIQRELALQMMLGYAFILSKGWAVPEVEQSFTRALEICENLGNPPEVFLALYGLWSNYHVRGTYKAARDQARELLRLAQVSGDHTQSVLAHYAMGETLLHTGELKLARQHQEIMLSLYDEPRDRPIAFQVSVDIKSAILSYAGWNLWLLGYPDQALATSKEAGAFARSLSHPNSIASAEFFLTIVQRLRGEADAVQQSAERVIALSAEHGFGAWLLFSTTHRGWALAQQGRAEEGIALMSESRAAAHSAGADIGRSADLCNLAEARMKMGRLDDALSTVNEALAAVDKQEERFDEPDIHRVKGEVLLAQDHSNSPQAEECFRQAIEIARGQSSKSLELRATTSLARLLACKGRRDEARTMLAEIYNWFTEGFDTADLKEAKALLDQLPT